MKKKNITKNKTVKKKLKKDTGNYFDNQKVKIILVVILLSIFLLALWVKNNQDINNNDNVPIDDSDMVVDKFRVNDNFGVIEDKELNGLKFTNTSLIYSDNSSKLKTLVTNNTDSDIEVKIFDIYVKDKDGNNIVTLVGYVGEVVPRGNSREIESYVDMNLKDAYSIEYKIVN